VLCTVFHKSTLAGRSLRATVIQDLSVNFQHTRIGEIAFIFAFKVTFKSKSANQLCRMTAFLKAQAVATLLVQATDNSATAQR
jgi:hypothetical protein